jgi:hypothetical protein
MIFAADEDCEATWLVDAWDEYTMDANYDGYLEAVKKARAEHGEISVVKTGMDDDKVLSSFKPTEIPLTAD